jgi:hypothetical protein
MSHRLIDYYAGSHDCYLFHSSFLDNDIINDKYTNYQQNHPGIETRIIGNFVDSNFKIFNPCFQIKIVHLHETDLRRHGRNISLHRDNDDILVKSCWYIPPKILEIETYVNDNSNPND